MHPGSDTPTVLIVDDEADVAEVYSIRLDSEYETRIATGGREALEAMSPEIDIVLLDRRMPDLPGEDVLAEIRDRDYDCRVIMLTAVDPGPDIVDMAFDDYLCKPVKKADLVDAIELQLAIKRGDDLLAEYLEVRTKLTLLESTFSGAGSRGKPEIQTLQQRGEELRAKIEESETDIEAIERSFSKIRRRPG